MSFAHLSMAVVAPAFVKVDLNRRPVQHLEGGIVREVLVRDGQRVKAGDPALVLGDVGVDADRNRLSYRVHVGLEAEQSLRRLVFPAGLIRAAEEDDRIREVLRKEASLFAARRESMNGEVAPMQTQRERIEQETESLRAQIAQLQSSLDLQQQNLETNRDLLKAGYVSATRIVQIEAGVIDYAARLDERRSELSRAGLMIEARIRSEEVNHVQLDQMARIKMTAFKYRNTSKVEGKVTYVSGDRLIDKATNLPYYAVTIAADAESLKSMSELKLQAGRPAEV